MQRLVDGLYASEQLSHLGTVVAVDLLPYSQLITTYRQELKQTYNRTSITYKEILPTMMYVLKSWRCFLLASLTMHQIV